LLERFERFQFAKLAAGVEMDLAEELASFDEWLVADPKQVDSDLVDLQRALGVGPHGRTH
jgi:hypothetical protein